MSASTSKNEARANDSSEGSKSSDDFLKGEKVYFAQNHLSPDVQHILEGMVTVSGPLYGSRFIRPVMVVLISIQDHGGRTVTDRQSATLLIVHPRSPSYDEEQRQIRKLAREFPSIRAPKVVPYTYISLTSREILNPTNSPPTDSTTIQTLPPIFYHPDRTTEHRPLKAWVSVNVTRQSSDETAPEAQNAVMDMLVRGGALIVKKRAHADLLIVDRTTDFYHKVAAEREQNGRMHQRLEERDWVKAAMASGKMAWVLEGEEKEDGNEQAEGQGEGEGVKEKGKGKDKEKEKEQEAEGEDEVDSFAEDDAPIHKSGRGRPSGQ